jgi:indolepyruvate decarboxylase
MNLTEYLFTRLRELGVDHTFGIPGDFVLPVYAVQQQFGMPTVVCCHEPGVGFAADAYARLRGLGVAIVTYGAGAYNVLNPVACAYAEQSPLLVISGGPEIAFRNPDRLMHHVVKSYEAQLQIFQHVTADAAILDDPARAPEVIDRVLREVILQKRPGYLEIPRDRVHAPVTPPSSPLHLARLPHPLHAAALDEAIREISGLLAQAKKPALYVGVGVRRHGLTDLVVRLAETQKLPVATDVLGKASFPESHPQFVGVYMGAMGDPLAREVLDDSDCVLSLGVTRNDVNTGFYTERINPAGRVEIDAETVHIRFHRYDGLPMAEVVQAMVERIPPPRQRALPGHSAPEYTSPPNQAAGRLTIAQVIQALGDLDQSRFTFVADVGDSWFIGLELRADWFLAPGYYASMGFAVPGALGAGIADRSRRPIAIVGDGAFQMTGTELGTMVDCGLEPIILLVNNSCYGMLEAIDQPRIYYERRNWDYLAFARAMGAHAERAHSFADLAAALDRAIHHKGACLVEAVVAKEDHSPVMSRIRDFLANERASQTAIMAAT